MRRWILGASAAALLAVTGLTTAYLAIPPARAAASVMTGATTPVSADEAAATVAAMRPPKRSRPVVAVVAANDGTETTDYIVPYAVLSRSGVADVVALATKARPIKLMPALTVQPQATTADFDTRYPTGADYVIVPALHRRDDPTVVAWIKKQSALGATIVGVCSGVKTVSAAGLLSGRAATGHWDDVAQLRKANPTMRYLPDRRYVADRGIVTTTGVSASLPVSIALVEAIAGRGRAQEVASAFNLASWDAGHSSAAFRLDRAAVRTAVGNRIAFWKRESIGVPVSSGVDDVALAFTADAWSRTYRSKAYTVTSSTAPVVTRAGLTLLPDRTSENRRSLVMLEPPTLNGDAALRAALAEISRRFGSPTAAFVALQLEYALPREVAASTQSREERR